MFDECRVQDVQLRADNTRQQLKDSHGERIKKFRHEISARLVGGGTTEDATFDQGWIYMGPHVFILLLFQNPGSWIQATITITD